jgi:hypothetical protein
VDRIELAEFAELTEFAQFVKSSTQSTQSTQPTSSNYLNGFYFKQAFLTNLREIRLFRGGLARHNVKLAGSCYFLQNFIL